MPIILILNYVAICPVVFLIVLEDNTELRERREQMKEQYKEEAIQEIKDDKKEY